MTVFGDWVPNERLTPETNSDGVEMALKRMIHGKTMGPDNYRGGLQERGRRGGGDILLGMLHNIF